MRLVFATHNKNKFLEVQVQMPAHITLLSLEAIGCTEDIPETAATIEGNALQKAAYVKNKYGLACFADDTGLEVEALNGAPGVYSARYAGDHKSTEDNIRKLLAELENRKNRKARFKTVIAFTSESDDHLFTGICKGEITKEPQGRQGFGYDPVFRPQGYEKTFAEMTLKEKNTLGHRGKAIRELIQFLETYS
jgi:XTP/dITP diphosphohydrolase